MHLKGRLTLRILNWSGVFRLGWNTPSSLTYFAEVLAIGSSAGLT